MLKAYVKGVQTVRKKVQDDDPVVVSCQIDGWSKFHHGYLGVILSYITPKWKRASLTIGCIPFDESHTSANLSSLYNDLMDDWNLAEKNTTLVSDSAANMMGMSLYLPRGTQQVKCLNHILQLIINDELLEKPEISTLVKNVRDFSNYAANSVLLSNACSKVAVEIGGEYLEFIRDVQTRWNSTHDMLKRFIQNEDIVRRILDDPAWRTKIKSNVKFSNKDWELIKSVSEILEPFKEATLELSKSEACISQYIPTVKAIEMKLQPSAHNNRVKGLKERLLKNLLKRLGNVESYDIYTLSCLLDPRFKKWCFRSQEKLDDAVKLLVEKVQEECPVEISNEAEDVPTEVSEQDTNKNLFADMFKVIRSKAKAQSNNISSSASAQSTVEDYLESDLLTTSQILKHWSDYEKTSGGNHFKLGLCKLARQYLTPLPTSTSVERLFSSTGRLLDDRRSRLLPENLERMIFLRANVGAANFKLDWD